MLYIKKGFTIDIPIKDNFVITATIRVIDKEKNIYEYDCSLKNMEFLITDNDIVINQSIICDNPNMDISKEILRKVENGDFDEYIKRYHKQMKACDIGFTIMEIFAQSIWKKGFRICNLCKKEPCSSNCPNYIPPKVLHYCSSCEEGIYEGEEYIENDNGDMRHCDCFCGIIDLLEWLGYKIKTMKE